MMVSGGTRTRSPSCNSSKRSLIATTCRYSSSANISAHSRPRRTADGQQRRLSSKRAMLLRNRFPQFCLRWRSSPRSRLAPRRSNRSRLSPAGNFDSISATNPGWCGSSYRTIRPKGTGCQSVTREYRQVAPKPWRFASRWPTLSWSLLPRRMPTALSRSCASQQRLHCRRNSRDARASNRQELCEET